ncbi:Synaptojanin domain-containing protein [Rozella allomycis CSF55]|uniref:Synaptojanin domain-containing protein n=1 Tax=Rozella allomycis (strain CSF55) TaxID=988480 RepID=A0A075B4E5_ROZAC|nr:Synaptojanin domain-containing protein [Rozella allomycis CSF55]|eukprot:EPZ36290.1 Synaptojanin domain-containing protein [Rozella allomycis CSF55]
MISVHDSLRLYINSETITLEPVYDDPRAPSESLTFFRESGRFQINAPALHLDQRETIKTVFGILATYRLFSGDYLVVISERKLLTTIENHRVYEITCAEVIRLAKSVSHISDQQRMDEDEFVELLKMHVNNGGIIYSPTYEITMNMQERSKISNNNDPLFKKIDERFCWNWNGIQPLIQMCEHGSDVSRFIIPCIHGFVEKIKINIRNSVVDYFLISRRGWKRSGTRYHSRGVDENGNVSNFIETEQILFYQGNVHSFVQVRGSIPLYWEQQINIKYAPKLNVLPIDKAVEPFKKHLSDLKSKYGKVVLVNLINGRGYEGPLAESYRTLYDSYEDKNSVKYIHFDFNKECGKLRWDRLSELDEKLIEYYNSFKWFAKNENKVVQNQSGIIRSNCIDCLDRTNVVQSIIAKSMLNNILKELKLIEKNDSIDNYSDILCSFRNKVWADHADVCSFHYSGTGALKTDFTRTGSRTVIGNWNDFTNSITRYVKNNYLDGVRQDSIDFFLGKYKVNHMVPSPFLKDKTPKPYIGAAAIQIETLKRKLQLNTEEGGQRLIEATKAAQEACQRATPHEHVHRVFLNCFIKDGQFPTEEFININRALKMKYQVANPIQLAIDSVKPIVMFKTQRGKNNPIPNILTYRRQMSIGTVGPYKYISGIVDQGGDLKAKKRAS